ncbi:LysM peptidoglycan-binding domain-containing protein [Paracidovorax oryzae]|uniref:CdiA C-terminal domain-containing protein n=1 Tax=Paracidovorax oryzae TaxID=862720 RepID=UPI000A8C1E29|nr:LysM peptidoglycan-binding domain-containing protein [Paracidovorax oryzae]
MRYRYDAQGRKVGQTDAMGMTQAWNYDIFGHLIGRTDAQSGGGAPVDFNYTYNLAGQLVHEDNTRVEPGVGGAAATNKKKNIDYRYDGAGQLIEIRDNYLGQTTRYEYDLGGNRVAEKMSQKTLLTSGLLDDVVYQDNHLVYDAQHRLRAVFDGRSDVRITYDLAGNRSQVKTHVINTIRTTTEQGGLQERQVVHTDTTEFEYDAMNRQTRSQQKSSVNSAIETHKYFYDLAGNRVREQVFDGPAIPTDANGTIRKTYDYIYDDLHRLDSYTGAGAADMMDNIKYDGAGRQVASRTLVGPEGGSYEYRYNRYDATAKLYETRVVVRSARPGDNQKVAQRTNLLYHDTDGVTGLGYDAAGNLMGVRQDADGQITTTTYQYTYLNGSWQQSAALTRRGGDVVGTITQRDANGFVVGIRQPKVTGSAAQAPDGSLAAALTNQATQATSNDARYDRTFVNDANGTAVFVSQGGFNEKTEVNSSIANPASGYQGGVTGSALTPGHVQRQLVANGEVLARYGDAPTQEENTPQTNNPAYVDTADFRLQAAQIRPRHKSLDPVAYTVVGGETLKDIARNVLGDASLWWRIADANSLAVSGDGQLTAGQTLTVPKLALNANSVETFQPYDPSQAMGSMDPVLPVPANGGGCGGIGAIIMIVVAIVVTIYTAGAAASALGAVGTTTGAGVAAGTAAGVTATTAGTFAVGSAALAGSYGAAGIAAAAIGGAVGSIASQMVGNLIGAQDGFSWKSVALSALGSGITSGLGSSGWLPKMDSAFANAAVRQAVSGTISQGIGTVTGLQQRFDWKSVAAGAIGAGVGASVGGALDKANVFGSWGSDFATGLARGTVSGVAAGMTTAVLKGGRVSVQQVATDAFGNALGQSLAAASGPQLTFAQDTAARSRALDPMGLRQMAPTAASPDGEGAVAYPVRMPGDIETQPLPAQVEDAPRTVRAGEFGGSLERIARSQLGTGASQRAINNYVGQLFEINGISNARRIMPDQSIMLPGADTAAATTGLRLYGNDIAIGEQAAAARASLAAQQPEAQEPVWSFREAGMLQLKREEARALAEQQARISSGPSMSAWDGVTRLSTADTAATKIDAIRAAGPIGIIGGTIAYITSGGKIDAAVWAAQQSQPIDGVVGSLAGLGTRPITSLYPRRVPFGPSTGSLSGDPEMPPRNASTEQIRSINRQNEAAEFLAKNGFDVVQIPNRGAQGVKNPDLGINGQLADVYSPKTGNLWTVRDNIANKVESQAPNIVLNLADSPLQPGQVIRHLELFPVPVNNLVIIKNGQINVNGK